MRLLTLLILTLLLRNVAHAQSDELVNLDHLKHLTEPVTINGQDMAIVHIYAEYPDYDWVDDADEGLSAVDDVARAAVVYLWEYERTGEESLLELARRCLNFVMYMQADDGEFYNFVWDQTGRQNLTGGTSYKSLTWWAMRGLWSLGEGVRVFDSVDPAFADQLASAYLKTESALANTLGNYGEYTTVHGFSIPAWIPGGEANVAAIGLLGLSAYYEARPNEATADVITKIADGISEYRLGTASEYPFGLHPVRANAPGFWTNWGAHMPHALVMAGMALDREDWIDSAQISAESFLLRHLALEPFRHTGVTPNRLEQIAYGTNMLVQTYAALYRATGDEQFARYAGLAASWYFGNNMANIPMYSPETGRGFDGINGPVSWRVNRNSGAESTIEALMSMSVLASLPEAQPYISAQPEPFTSYRVLEAEAGQRVNGTPIYYTGNWTGEGYISGGRYVGLGEGQRMRLTFEVENAGDYLLYVAHQRQAQNSSSFVIPLVETPPTIDGNSSDWAQDATPLDSNSARQFVRGGGIWKGAEVDSHSLLMSWDADNLYLVATVRDPAHLQEQTVSNVWQGDSLWLYFTAEADARNLSAKFTLAQTPNGAQIWDWTNTEFALGSTLAWQPTDSGYIYEASIPWSTIGVENPQGGSRIGFEAGRGVGGSAFMNLTGRDPDVAANLLELTLITPDSSSDLASSANVSLAVRLNSDEDIIIPQTVSPDSDYFWLDLVTQQPVTLETGENRIRYEYAGEEGATNPGISKVDAFVLFPVIAERGFTLADGRHIELTLNLLTGESTWEETP